jgi:hypothetical protein
VCGMCGAFVGRRRALRRPLRPPLNRPKICRAERTLVSKTTRIIALVLVAGSARIGDFTINLMHGELVRGVFEASMRSSSGVRPKVCRASSAV